MIIESVHIFEDLVCLKILLLNSPEESWPDVGPGQSAMNPFDGERLVSGLAFVKKYVDSVVVLNTHLFQLDQAFIFHVSNLDHVLRCGALRGFQPLGEVKLVDRSILETSIFDLFMILGVNFSHLLFQPLFPGHHIPVLEHLNRPLEFIDYALRHECTQAHSVIPLGFFVRACII